MKKAYTTPRCKATPRTPEELTSDYLVWLEEHPEATGYIYEVTGATKAAKCTALMRVYSPMNSLTLVEL